MTGQEARTKTTTALALLLSQQVGPLSLSPLNNLCHRLGPCCPSTGHWVAPLHFATMIPGNALQLSPSMFLDHQNFPVGASFHLELLIQSWVAHLMSQALGRCWSYPQSSLAKKHLLFLAFIGKWLPLKKLRRWGSPKTQKGIGSFKKRIKD